MAVAASSFPAVLLGQEVLVVRDPSDAFDHRLHLHRLVLERVHGVSASHAVADDCRISATDSDADAHPDGSVAHRCVHWLHFSQDARQEVRHQPGKFLIIMKVAKFEIFNRFKLSDPRCVLVARRDRHLLHRHLPPPSVPTSAGEQHDVIPERDVPGVPPKSFRAQRCLDHLRMSQRNRLDR